MKSREEILSEILEWIRKDFPEYRFLCYPITNRIKPQFFKIDP